MTSKLPTKDNLSRIEDYRDYEDRNVDEGWPYDDDAGAASKPPANRAYGETAANFDQDTNAGFEVEPMAADGDLPDPALAAAPESDPGIADDDLEERVLDALTGVDGFEENLIDIRAKDGIIALEGTVDEQPLLARILATATAVKGVQKVKNRIRLNGVDAYLPSDD